MSVVAIMINDPVSECSNENILVSYIDVSGPMMVVLILSVAP